jgi:hypothetical protein
MRLLKFASILALFAVACAPAYAQTNPAVGTWKLNVEKSKYTPGPAPKSLTRTLEAQGENVKYSFEGVSAEGTGVAYSFTVAFDGKESPITGSMPGGADAITIKRTDANTFEATLTKSGKVVGTAKSEISKDGKVTTVTAQGTDGDGRATTSSAVYDKQ